MSQQGLTLNMADVHGQLLIVEDIVDTGRTVESLRSLIAQAAGQLGAKALGGPVKVATLLHKRLKSGAGRVEPDFAGFSIPDRFVVGYGLDFNEFFRDMPCIGVLNAEGQRKFAL